LGRSAAGEHTYIGMPANQHDGMQSSAIQWENISLVLEQNDAFFG
jgi:hypothetical protein